MLGVALSLVGDLRSAQQAYAQALELARERSDAWAEMAAQIGLGDVLKDQGDGPGALTAYRHSLAIAEALAARDPANTQWQIDVVVSCAKLGTLEHGQSVAARRDYLERGLAILIKLKADGQLMADQNWIELFEELIQQLPT